MNYEQMEQCLTVLYTSMDGIDENTPDGIMLPANIIKKIDIYRDVLQLVGDLHAIAHGQVKWYEFKKKETFANEYLNTKGKPVKEREQFAVLASNEHRKKMTQWERVALKWHNRYKTTEHIINALKWKIRDAHHTDNGGQ